MTGALPWFSWAAWQNSEYTETILFVRTCFSSRLLDTTPLLSDKWHNENDLENQTFETFSTKCLTYETLTSLFSYRDDSLT
jgi:hypothetical protein